MRKKRSWKFDFDAHPVAPTPNQLGVNVVDNVSFEDVVPYIDWNPFFQTYELRGRYPNRAYLKSFNDEAV
jgi:5-methyltetrahydrofolate--homocysteine methyltransferase